MNIGQAAKLSGLRRKTIRYYEDIGLVRPGRTENGYRDFSALDCNRLKFLGRARSLGFSVEECRALLTLYDDNERPSGDVRRIALAALDRLGRQQEACETLRMALTDLLQDASPGRRPDAPVLPDMANGLQSAPAREA